MEPSHSDPSHAPNYGVGGHTPVVVSTVFTTVYPTLLPPHGPSRITQDPGASASPSSSSSGVRPTPTLTLRPPEGGRLPNEEFLVRTVLLSNMTVIHNEIESFKDEMERKLTKAYRHAYVVRMRHKRSVAAPPALARDRTLKGVVRVGRVIREAVKESEEEKDEEESEIAGYNEDDGGNDDDAAENERAREGRENGDSGEREWPRVKIHNIRSSLPEPEIEMIYTVSKGEYASPKMAILVLDLPLFAVYRNNCNFLKKSVD